MSLHASRIKRSQKGKPLNEPNQTPHDQESSLSRLSYSPNQPPYHRVAEDEEQDNQEDDDDSEHNVDNEDGNQHLEKLRFPKQYGILKMEAIIERLRTRHPGWGVKSVYIAMYLLSTITSTENNSLPLIEPYFLSVFGQHSSLATVGIIINIAYAVGKPPTSQIMDVFGRAEGVLVAMILYLIGAILTASATGLIQFSIGRIAAALGSQGLQLAQMIIVADTSSLASRGFLTSTITSPWIFTTWIGPIFGSWFLSKGPSGYRAIYLVFGFAVPLCASWLALVLWFEWRQLSLEAKTTRRLGGINRVVDSNQEDSQENHSPSSSKRFWFTPIPRSDTTSSHAQSINQSFKARTTKPRFYKYFLSSQAWQQLDFVGLILLILGSGLVLLPLTWSNHETGTSWFTPQRCFCLLIGAVGLLFFGLYESKFAKFPVMPTRLFKRRTVLLGSCVCFWHFICQYSYESYFTSFLQVARFSSARNAQYIQQSYLFTACVSAIICGLLAKWTSRYKIWLIVGILIHSVGTLLMVRTRKLDNPIAEIVISQIIGGFGGGFTTLACQVGVQAAVTHEDVAITTAVFLMITQIGGAVGSSLAGSVWTSQLQNRLSLRLPESEQINIPKIIGDLRFALKYEGPNREAINEAYVDVQRTLNWLGVWALLPCLICALFMENVDLESKPPLETASRNHSSDELLRPSQSGSSETDPSSDRQA